MTLQYWMIACVAASLPFMADSANAQNKFNRWVETTPAIETERATSRVAVAELSKDDALTTRVTTTSTVQTEDDLLALMIELDIVDEQTVAVKRDDAKVTMERRFNLMEKPAEKTQWTTPVLFDRILEGERKG